MMNRIATTTQTSNSTSFTIRAKKLVSFVSACCLAMSTILLSISPEQAQAKTLAQFDAEIATQQTIVNEKNQQNEEAQAVLAKAAKWYYQNALPEDLLQLIITGNDISDTFDKVEYVGQIYNDYVEKAAAAKQAKTEAEAAKQELEGMRAERANRAKSLEEAKTIQFPQGGNNAWSGLPYWTGSVARAGCGLCSYTVVIDVLTGNNYTPADMLGIRGDWKGMDGYPDNNTGSGNESHADFTRRMFEVETYNISHDVETLKQELSNGEACSIVCAAGRAFKNKSGTWRYSSGHFIAVVGYDEQGFHVADSAYSSDQGTDVVYSDGEMATMLSRASHVTIYKN